MTYDAVVRNGTVVDGTGRPRFRADVAIDGDRIVDVGIVTERGRREIDATGQLVAPGFIDVHTHLDAQLLWDATGTTPAWHGVTSVVMGNCGFTLAPCSREQADLAIRSIERAEDISRRAIELGVDWTWTTYADYLAKVAALPKGVNVGGYVGHSALRAHAMGERAFEQAEATDADLDVMRRELAAALHAGALGFSTSRTHHHLTMSGAPVASRIAPWAEVVELVTVSTENGGRLFQLAPERAVDPAERADFQQRLGALADRTGATVSFMVGGDLDLLDGAVTAAAGGRIVGQTNVRATTSVLNFRTTTPFDKLPLWSRYKALPLAEKHRWLADEDTRARLVDEAVHATYAATVGAEARPPDYDRMDVLDSITGPNRSVAQVASVRRVHPVQAMVDLALETDLEQFFVQPLTAATEAEIERALHHRSTVIAASDAGAHISQIMDSAIPTYFLAHWVRDRQSFTWEQAVHKLTGEVATIWRLAGRGRIGPGFHADLVVFDPDAVGPELPEVAYDLPDGGPRLVQRATGISTTLVNGQVYLDEGKLTDTRAGQLLTAGAGAG